MSDGVLSLPGLHLHHPVNLISEICSNVSRYLKFIQSVSEFGIQLALLLLSCLEQFRGGVLKLL